MAITAFPYVWFDCEALGDPAHWTKLAGGFIALDGAMGVLGFKAYLKKEREPFAPKAKKA